MDKSTLHLTSTQRSKISKASAIQEAARKSLVKLLRPLTVFVFDCGFSISEVNLLLRSAAVQSAAERQRETSNRVSISGIAAITGIPREEVSRILNSNGKLITRVTQGRQNICSKILSAWHCDPQFSRGAYQPRVLKVFGPGRTFQSLVKKHGQGIPVRAIVDELKRAGVIQLSASQKIRPKMPLAINPLITAGRIRDLDATLAGFPLGLLDPSGSASAKKMFRTKVWSGRASEVRRRFGSNAIAMVREFQLKLDSEKVRHCSEYLQGSAHLSIMITYGEGHAQLPKNSPKRRRNFDHSV